MIVVSVVLIVVAVALLVLGVAGGSSTLLISSIVASLLAAIALVIGVRQTAVRRAVAAPVPEPLEPDVRAGPGPDLPVSGPVRAASAGPAAAAGSSAPAGPPASPPPARPEADDRTARGWRGRAEARPEPSFADNPPAPDEGLASPTDTKPRVAAPEDAGAALAADAEYRSDAEAGADPDYQRASSVIGAARSDIPDENAWRRPPADGDDSADADRPGYGGPDQPAARDLPGTAGYDEPGVRDPRDRSGDAGLADEFGEPDADDPDDEPLPQAVRPADAVRVARMPTEVLVIDGRPRYHLADCPHLVGRLTEALPVSEAVELGFSPCGLCRPVDRLVAHAAQF
jgi:hypothetical protein